MFKVDELRQLFRVSKGEFLIALVTIAAVLGVGILKGVLVACIARGVPETALKSSRAFWIPFA